MAQTTPKIALIPLTVVVHAPGEAPKTYTIASGAPAPAEICEEMMALAEKINRGEVKVVRRENFDPSDSLSPESHADR